MVTRPTTIGSLRTYRYNLQHSFSSMDKAMNQVMSGRYFNSFAEDPVSAARSFQLRRSYTRNTTQSEMNSEIVHKFDVAWQTLDRVEEATDTVSGNSSVYAVLVGKNDPDASGRNALGQQLCGLADTITQAMNNRYSDDYVFSGADGTTVPFTWETRGDGTRQLCYRGIPVDAAGVPAGQTADPDPALQKAQQEALEYMAGEKKYADIGVGFKEEDGQLVRSSVFNMALQGINFLGYGTTEVTGESGTTYHLPNNVASIVDRMGKIFQNCDPVDGHWASDEEKEEFQLLAEKLEESAANLKNKRTELDTQTGFLKNNQTQLDTLSDELNAQITDLERPDEVESITSFIFAKYTYGTALKVGNSVLGQSLMDYLNF